MVFHLFPGVGGLRGVKPRQTREAKKQITTKESEKTTKGRGRKRERGEERGGENRVTVSSRSFPCRKLLLVLKLVALNLTLVLEDDLDG